MSKYMYIESLNAKMKKYRYMYIIVLQIDEILLYLS